MVEKCRTAFVAAIPEEKIDMIVAEGKDAQFSAFLEKYRFVCGEEGAANLNVDATRVLRGVMYGVELCAIEEDGAMSLDDLLDEDHEALADSMINNMITEMLDIGFVFDNADFRFYIVHRKA